MNKYYVYAYFEGDTPIYIGAGCGRRDVSHYCRKETSCPSFHNKLQRMLRNGVNPRPKRLLVDLSVQESWAWERFFIQALGRRDLGTGPLYNRTDGGPGHKHGLVSVLTRQRMSKAVKEALAQPSVRRKHLEAIRIAQARPEAKQNHSKATKVRYLRPGERQQTSVAAKAAHARLETKQRQSKAERHKPPKGESQLKGVRPHRKKWQARIADYYLGTFETPEAAALAYNDGVDKYWDGDGYKNPVNGEGIDETV
jgi:hypothetical protein